MKECNGFYLFIKHSLPLHILWTSHVPRESALGWCTDASVFLGAIAHHLAVDCAGHAVVQLSV